MRTNLHLKLPGSYLALALEFVVITSAAFAQGTAFTYQGKLTDSGNLANGQYDFQFKLFDALTAGTQLGATQTLSPVPVTNSIFTVSLDFGVCATCFDGAARFLEIAVRPTGGGSFTPLSPRQPITSAPYALKSQNATTANGLSVACVNCVTSSQIQSVNGSTVTGTIPVASVPPGSGSYIQNTSSQQASSNFNVSGNGTADILNATTGYDFGGVRVLSAAGTQNLFAGISAGGFNTGSSNAFFGFQAGFRNTTGNQNAFFGRSAGSSNTIGMQNTFIGFFADFDLAFSSTGDNNTLLGAHSRVISGSSNAAAIGFRAQVGQSNSLVLGSINGVNSATADTKVGIGTTAPDALLDVQRDGGAIPQAWFTAYGAPNEILGRASDGTRASPTATLSGTTLLSLGATGHNGNGFVTVPRASILMDAAQAWAPSATGTQMRFRTTANDTTGILTRMIITNDGNVGIGTSNPLDLLHVNGDVRVGAGTTGCVKDSDGTVIAGSCSSDARLKRDITPFPHLLEKLVQLQPVHFYWRSAEFPDRHLGAAQSFGLVAQEVEKAMPELVTEDASGFKVIHYHKLPLLMLEAIKELKAENDVLKQKLQKVEQEQRQIESLRKIICLDHPQADICK